MNNPQQCYRVSNYARTACAIQPEYCAKQISNLQNERGAFTIQTI